MAKQPDLPPTAAGERHVPDAKPRAEDTNALSRQVQGAGVLVERRRRLAAAPRLAEPMDCAYVLSPLVDRAQTIGAADVEAQLRLEIYATGTHAQIPGRPRRAARFAFIPPPLREKGAVELIASWATEGEAPPLFRAHEWDLVWSIEEGPRAHPHAGLDAAAMYLEYDALVPDTVFGPDDDLGPRFELLDALGRAAQLARETKDKNLAERVRDRILVRLKEIEAKSAYRYLLELGYALIEIEAMAPGGLDAVDALIEPAVAHFKSEINFNLARDALQLAVETNAARKRPDEDLRRRIAESHVEEADQKQAAGGAAMLVAWAIQEAIEAYRGLRDSQKRVGELTARLEHANTASLGDLKPITAEVEIPTVRVDALINEIIRQPRDAALTLVGVRFLVDRQASYDRADRMTKEFVLQSMVTVKILTAYGETIELRPGTPERREHEAMKDALLSLAIGDKLLVEIFEKLRADGLTVAQIMQVLRTCLFFPAKALELIESGLGEWFDGDHVGAAHVLVPQIEAVVRFILQSIGVPVTRVSEGHVQLRLLDSLLGQAAQYGLPDPIVFTLEAVLTDRGNNVRNRVAHGWFSKSECTPELCARVVQLLLSLATLEAKEAKE